MLLLSSICLLAWLGLAAKVTAASTLKCADLFEQATGFGNLTLTKSATVNISDAVIANLTKLTGGQVNNTIPFCRVQGNLTYGDNYTMQVEVWLPSESSWNKRYMAVGNGGLAGYIEYNLMVPLLNQGFAVISGDSGHTYAETDNGTPQPGEVVPFLTDTDQVTAWLHNSVALETPPTKALVSQFYSQDPTYSYYYGCSTGGAQGFALAQYWPDLFDGIYAGSPGNWYSHLILSFLWNYQHSQGASHIDQDTLNLITNATIQACDANDGVIDGVISNPLNCTFDIQTLACPSSEQAQSRSLSTTPCLTPAQIATYNAFRAGPIEPDTHIQVYPGFNHGSESAWLVQEHDLAYAYSIPILQNLIFQNLSYNPTTQFSFSSPNILKVNQTASPLIDAITANLTTFMDHPGKMIVTQGWADPYNAATWPIDHLRSIDDFLVSQGGAEGGVSEFLRLFMVPAGGHCGANLAYPGVPATYHVVEALVGWVERGEEPEYIRSSDPPDGSNRTSKLCPWPQIARLGEGQDQDDWQSYQCS